MNKVIHLSLARKSVPILMDVVQSATAPSIEFVLDDYTPPSNARARIYIKKDGGEVYNNCTLSGNVVTYTPTAGSFDVPGQCVAQLELVQGSTVAVSWRIFVTVEPNLINGSAAPASTEYNALTQLIVNAQRYDGIIGANNITGYNNRQGWIALTSGQDLNTVTAPGVYYCATNAIAASLLNCPTARNFTMVVSYGLNNATYVTQRIMEGNTVYIGYEYKRSTNNSGSTWAVWQTLPLRSEVNAIANGGAKNLCPNGITSQVINGLTVTRNADGTVTLNGTTNANTTLTMGNANIKPGTHKVSVRGFVGSKSGGFYARNYADTASVCAASLNTEDVMTAQGVSRVWLYFNSGTSFDNETIAIMIRDASIQDDTYVPYGMSNAELTARQPKVLYMEVKPADYPLSQVYGGYMTAPYTIPEGTEILGVMLFATAGVSQYPVIPVTPSKTTVRFWMPTNSYTSVGAYVTVR